MEKVKVDLIEGWALIRRYCHVCGGCTWKSPILAEVKSGPHEGFRVCESCLKERDFDAKLNAHAQELEAEAADLRGLIGRLDVPTYAEYRRAYEKHDRDYLAESRAPIKLEEDSRKIIQGPQILPMRDDFDDSLPF